MKKRSHGGVSRRGFLKSTVIGAAALGLGPTILIPRRLEAYALGEPTHPNISPLRVVGLHDPKMTTDVLEASTWQQQEQLLQADVVAENLDRMACALAQEKNVTDAWKAIFLKPAKKSWSDTVVAVKVNYWQAAALWFMSIILFAWAGIGVSPRVMKKWRKYD